MEQKTKEMNKPSHSQEPEIKKSQEDVKAAHLSSNPMNGEIAYPNSENFDVGVYKAFFSVFFGCEVNA